MIKRLKLKLYTSLGKNLFPDVDNVERKKLQEIVANGREAQSMLECKKKMAIIVETRESDLLKDLAQDLSND